MITRLTALAGGLALATMVCSTLGEPVVIHNATLEVQFDAGSGRFSLMAVPTQRTFLRDGRLSADAAATRIVTVTDRTFGRGQAIEVTSPKGDRDAVLLFPNLPFALFRTRLHNGGNAASVTRSIRTFSGVVDWGAPAAALTTLGTGGLLAPDKNPGSYAWLAVAEPQTRHGIVGGWLTFSRGSGVVFTQVESEAVRMRAQIDYGRLRLNPGKTEDLETFALGYFEDARFGLEAWADAVAKVYSVHLPPQPAGYCTWYSRPHGGASDEQHLAEQDAFAAAQLKPFGFSVIQIDDGWQAGISTNGPKRNFTTHRANGPYPGGMKATANRIRALSLVPGVWFMPFAGTYYDPFFQAHQDWFVKRDSGEPYETAWGGTCLDLTHPAVRDYLRRNIRRLTRDWGFQYFKMDGLWTGTATKQVYVNSGYKDDGIGDAVFHNAQKTNLEAYRDGLKLVRAAAGKDVFILGCCSPQNMRSYGGAFGLVNAMRIGPDNGSEWNHLLNGPRFGSRQYFLHGRVWYNDPDPVYVRASMPLEQARLICSWVALSGQLNLSSEWLPGLPPERLDILKRTMPSHGLRPRPADLFEQPLPRIWLLTDDRHPTRRDVIGLFNWDDRACRFDYPLDRLGLDGATEYVGFDYWENALVPSIRGRLAVQVPPRSCKILALRPRLDRPEVISTSRHITQGIVDINAEHWNPATSTLRGRSQVVANDPYELRIVTSGKDQPWRLDRLTVSATDQAAGVKTAFNETAGLVRVTIQSAASREILWEVRFRVQPKPGARASLNEPGASRSKDG
jgi:hypothetical protein